MGSTTLYNPASLNKEDLISSFVVRTKTFEKIFKDIKNGDMRYPEKHYVIQGQRGMGKTTLLLRLKYEVEKDEKLRDWLVPVFFNEESYDVNSLAGLWEKLLKYLDGYFDTDGKFYDYTEQFLDAADYEKKCLEYLIGVLKARNKKLIIFFDNFGELFLDNLREKEKRRLREVLIDCSELRIVAASAVVINDLHDYTQPFYEFFQVVYLDGLTKDETYELISKLQQGCDEARKIDLKKNRAKIDTLAVLTGGVIRTIMMLYQVLLDDQDGSALEDLEKVLDKATPLYKHRIEDLPVQQRRIVDVIAKKWDAASAKEIATEIREDGKNVSTKLVSAQLSQLEKNNIIEKKQTNTKNHLYQLRERFFNIWYLMRNGDRRERRRVEWLTKFLEMWYSEKEELSNFVAKHVKQLKTGKYKPKSALLMIDALLNTEKIESDNIEILYDETRAVLDEEHLKQLPSLSKVRVAKVRDLMKSGEYTLAMDYAERIEDNPLLRINFLLLLSFKMNDRNKVAEILQSVDYNEKIFGDNLKVLLPYYLYARQFQEVVNLHRSYGSTWTPREFEMLACAYGVLQDDENEVKYALEALKGGRSIPVEVLTQKRYDESEVVGAFTEGLRLNSELKVDMLDYIFLKYDINKQLMELISEILDSIDQKSIKKSFRLSVYNLIRSADLSKDGEMSIDTDLDVLQSIIKKYDGRSKQHLKLVHNFLLQVYLYDLKSHRKDIERLCTELVKQDMVYSWAVYAQAFVVMKNYHMALEIVEEILDDKGEEVYQLNRVFIELLSQKQYHMLYELFDRRKTLREMFRPVYYALMTFLEKEFPNEVLKMGGELKEPVKGILEAVKIRRAEYK